VSTPLKKNINQLGWLFPIYGKIISVPNHQPDNMYVYNCIHIKQKKHFLTISEKP
jgi:hypothetical protein